MLACRLVLTFFRRLLRQLLCGSPICYCGLQTRALETGDCNQPWIDDHDERVIRETCGGTVAYCGSTPAFSACARNSPARLGQSITSRIRPISQTEPIGLMFTATCSVKSIGLSE